MTINRSSEPLPNFVIWVFTIIILIFICYCQLNNLQMFVVASGSMEPALTIGSLIITQPHDRYFPGQVIAYYKSFDHYMTQSVNQQTCNHENHITFSNNAIIKAYSYTVPVTLAYSQSSLFDQSKSSNTDTFVVTHRVIGTLQKDGQIFYRTKGDANPQQDDQLVESSQVVGKVWLVFPFVGYLLLLPHFKLGFYFIVILPSAWIIFGQVCRIATILSSSFNSK